MIAMLKLLIDISMPIRISIVMLLCVEKHYKAVLLESRAQKKVPC